MKQKHIILSLLFILLPVFNAQATSLKTHHPHRYVVKEGDTLWTIAEKFLDEPWEWEKLWHANPQLKSPQDLYPGMELVLHNEHGESFLSIAKRNNKTLAPKIRKYHLRHSIPPIPLHAIKPFLNNSRVLSENELSQSPYIVAFDDEHVIGGTGALAYANDILTKHHKIYSIFRTNGVYSDPHTHAVLGYPIEYIGKAHLKKIGVPATLVIDDLKKEVNIKDHLIPTESEPYRARFYPHAPQAPIAAHIIDFLNALTLIGDHQVVVIDQGKHEQLRMGDVLAIHKAGAQIHDPYDHKKHIILPDEHIGELLIFRVFDHVSYGVVMQTTRPIELSDLVSNP